MFKNTINVLKNRNNVCIWLLLAISTYLFVPSYLTELIWIKTNKVYIENNKFYTPIKMSVDRKIISSFTGTYSVTIRRDTGEYVCQGVPKSSIQYHPKEILPSPLYLHWWLGGIEILDSCRRNGFTIGKYYIETCHTVMSKNNFIPLARTCNKSNTFEVTL
jgi:hypothetical protein